MGTNDEDKEVSVCANCGKGEEESEKLKACTACKMVKYCSRECQIAHRSQHKKECRKRAAVLHDEELFKQPPPAEDCPICFLRMPSFDMGYKYMSCCGKEICSGCAHAPVYDNQGNKIDDQKCAFCRTLTIPVIDSIEREKIRVEADDPIAIYNHGCYYQKGIYGFPQDFTKALELWHRSAELGCARSYNSIAITHELGEGVKRDKKKGTFYFEKAAMAGHGIARYNLGVREEINAGNIDRALKHYMIAVGSGHSDSLKRIQNLYLKQLATKEDYTKALREYLCEIKSDQRDKAAAADEENRYY